MIQLTKDLNFEHNFRVVEILLACEDENIVKYTVMHMLRTIIAKKGSDHIRKSYQDHVGCILEEIIKAQVILEDEEIGDEKKLFA